MRQIQTALVTVLWSKVYVSETAMEIRSVQPTAWRLMGDVFQDVIRKAFHKKGTFVLTLFCTLSVFPQAYGDDYDDGFEDAMTGDAEWGDSDDYLDGYEETKRRRDKAVFSSAFPIPDILSYAHFSMRSCVWWNYVKTEKKAPAPQQSITP